MHQSAFACALAVVFASAAGTVHAHPCDTTFCLDAVVVGISDGDTVTILDAERRQRIKVRLTEIDTPERGQPWGTRARQALADKVFRRDVRVASEGRGPLRAPLGAALRRRPRHQSRDGARGPCVGVSALLVRHLAARRRTGRPRDGSRLVVVAGRPTACRRGSGAGACAVPASPARRSRLSPLAPRSRRPAEQRPPAGRCPPATRRASSSPNAALRASTGTAMGCHASGCVGDRTAAIAAGALGRPTVRAQPSSTASTSRPAFSQSSGVMSCSSGSGVVNQRCTETGSRSATA